MLLMTKPKRQQPAELNDSDISIEGYDSTSELLKLCQLTKKDMEALAKIDDMMQEHAPIIAERHYNMIMMIPEIREIFNNNTTFRVYTSLITKYFKQLTKPSLDADYIKYRRKIGRIHSRIHLTDDWYIGSYTRVYEYLYPLIIDKFHSKPKVLADILIALNRIITFDSLIVLDAYQEANDFYLVENINSVTESVIGANKVKDLLHEVSATVNETSTISEAARELSQSVQQVADDATTVSENIVNMVDESHKSQGLIQHTLTNFMEMSDDFTRMQEKISHLMGDMQEVTKVVDLIQDIADQTNLLALNASIEAARAGESGRGFSVVASEIRSLAEQTKSSVNQINDTMQGIQVDSGDVNQTAKQMSSSLTERSEQATDAIEIMKKMINLIEDVGQSTGNIAAIAQEQSAATQNITDRIYNVHEYTEAIEEKSNTTGESILQASMEVDYLRNDVMNAIPSLTSGQLQRVVQTENSLRGWWLYNLMLGFSYREVNDKIVNASCKLSEWLNKAKNEQEAITHSQVFADLERLHQTFHRQINHIYQLITKGDKVEAEQQMDTFHQLSEQIIEKVEQLHTEFDD